MSKSQIFPESCYEFKSLSLDEVKESFRAGQTVTGYVENIRSEEECISVKLGDNITAKLPFSEVTIYPWHYTQNPNRTLPVQIGILLHKCIRVKIKEITPDDGVILSRRDNMMEAYKHLATCSSAYFHITNVKTTMAFGDIGEGVVACMNIREVCRARIRSVSEMFHKGDKVWVDIIDEDNSYRFFLSYKSRFPKYNPDDYHPGDPVIAKVGEATDEQHTGYFVSITPQVTGILDVTTWANLIQYGNTVECEVARATEKGLKLRFVKIIE